LTTAPAVDDPVAEQLESPRCRPPLVTQANALAVAD
jgi:hypothetical protein